MAGVAMDYKVELVALALHDAERHECLWDHEPVIHKERFREYARNAISLLGEDIGVLLWALENCRRGEEADEEVRSVGRRRSGTRLW
jgi:hypothetical protein